MSASTVELLQRAELIAVADALLQARRDRSPADASTLMGALRDTGDAYGVQALVARALHGQDRGFPSHWKSGGPSRDGALTHAPLPTPGVWASPADARDWPCNIRLVEVEIALRLGREVTPADAAAVSHEKSATWVDAMAVSIELVDSRWRQGIDAPSLLKLADLQSHGALVLGEWRPFSARDWSSQECAVRIGGRPLERRRGTHALGDPAWVLPAWLRHVTRTGAAVPKGTVVTTGTWCGMLPASAGDLITASFEGVGEACLQL